MRDGYDRDFSAINFYCVVMRVQRRNIQRTRCFVFALLYAISNLGIDGVLDRLHLFLCKRSFAMENALLRKDDTIWSR